jgi:hypothetical protein
MISMVRRSDSSRFLGARGSMPGKTTDARRPSGLGMYSGGGEYGALVGLEVRLEEVPRHARRGVLRVEPDMAAPDREQRHGSTQLARHRERLWVVNHQDVTGADQLSQALRVRPVHGLVEYPVGLAELRHAFAVNQVVDPLGELEEPGIVAADDHPFDLHSQAAEQRHDGGQHLGDAAAFRRRVDHPDRPARELRHHALGLEVQFGDGGGEVGDGGVVIDRVRRGDPHPLKRRAGLSRHRGGRGVSSSS